MDIRVSIDDALWSEAQAAAGIDTADALVATALRALIARLSGSRTADADPAKGVMAHIDRGLADKAAGRVVDDAAARTRIEAALASVAL
ncbi:MAG: type II toxin-antitoxin system VapB family antitoxin [Maricaulaceae bacterium]